MKGSSARSRCAAFVAYRSLQPFILRLRPWLLCARSTTHSCDDTQPLSSACSSCPGICASVQHHVPVLFLADADRLHRLLLPRLLPWLLLARSNRTSERQDCTAGQLHTPFFIPETLSRDSPFLAQPPASCVFTDNSPVTKAWNCHI